MDLLGCNYCSVGLRLCRQQDMVQGLSDHAIAQTTHIGARALASAVDQSITAMVRPRAGPARVPCTATVVSVIHTNHCCVAGCAINPAAALNTRCEAFCVQTIHYYKACIQYVRVRRRHTTIEQTELGETRREPSPLVAFGAHPCHIETSCMVQRRGQHISRSRSCVV